MNRNDLEKLFGREIEIEDLRKWTVNDVAGYLAVTGYEADPEDVVNSIRIVCAASALGSIRSEKKAAASRENGKLGGRPTFEEKARDRVAKSPRLSAYQDEILHDDFCTADHWKWVATATIDEIVGWADAVRDAAES